jgi:hypothetical protein
MTNEEIRERRWAALDEYLADQDFDRRLHEHLSGLCDTDKCFFCEEDWEAAIRENQDGNSK